MKKTILLFLLLISASVLTRAQQPPFWNEIQAFKKQDSLAFPGTGKILFVGSSSFTKWKDVQEYFPSYPIINRGFGGSSLPDLIRYREEVIFRYKPKQVVIYCGENDFAASDTVSVATVVNRFKELFRLIRSNDPKVPVAYISMKPSPSRVKLLEKFRQANELIRQFLKKQKHTDYINVYDSMLKPDGTPVDDIFVADRLHMNEKGYAIWQKIIKPYLLK